MFEHQVVREKWEDKKEWSHEKMTCDMIDYIIQNNPKIKEAYEKLGHSEMEKDFEFIKALINPVRNIYLLAEIVASVVNPHND